MMNRKLIPAISISGTNAVVGLITTMFLARVADVEEYGLYLLMFANATILNLIIDYSSEKCFIDFCSNKNFKFNKAISNIITLRFLLLIVITIGISIYNIISNNEFGMLLILFLIPSQYLGCLYEKLDRNITYVLILFLEKIIMLALSFLLLELMNSDFYPTICLAYFISSILTLILQYSLVKKYVIFNPNFRDIFLYIRSYFLVLAIAILQLSYTVLSRLIIEKNYGIDTFLGISIALQIISLGSIYQTQIDKVFRKKLNDEYYNHNSNNLKFIIAEYFKFAIMPMITISLLIFYFSNDILNFIYGEKYSEYSSILSVLSFILITIPILRLFDLISIIVNKTKKSVISNILILILLFLFLSAEINSDLISYFLVLLQVFHCFLMFMNIRGFFKK